MRGYNYATGRSYTTRGVDAAQEQSHPTMGGMPIIYCFAESQHPQQRGLAVMPDSLHPWLTAGETLQQELMRSIVAQQRNATHGRKRR